MVLDVDHFKKFNDTHGHLAGDEVLKFVAQNIRAQTRDTELFARYGGEEFVVVFRGETRCRLPERADAAAGFDQRADVHFRRERAARGGQRGRRRNRHWRG